METMNAEVVENDDHPELMPVKTNPQLPEPVKAPEKPPMTAAQAKIDAVASLTATAYAKASELQLTPEETAALKAPFPDDAFRTGAGGKEDLIYIEHAHLRERLTSVLGMGQWAIVPRSRWVEQFEYVDRARQSKMMAERVYVEAMLVVRGCFVAEAIGDMVYYPKNQATNYGDAVEGAQSEALRRCCKNFGIGLQAWSKSWCEGWWARKKGATRPAPKAVEPVPEPPPSTEAPPEPPAPQQARPSGQGQMHPQVAALQNEDSVRLQLVVDRILPPAQGKKAMSVYFKDDPTRYFSRHKFEAVRSGDILQVDIQRSDYNDKPMYWVVEWVPGV